MADRTVTAASFMEPITLMPSEAEHVAGLKPVGDIYEVPKGAKFVYLVADRSALRVADVKNPDAAAMRLVIEQSIDGGITFGNGAGDGGAYRDGEVSYSLRDELVIGEGVLTSVVDVAKGAQEVGDAWNSQALGPRATHIRCSIETYMPLKCGIKVAFG